MLKKIKDRLYDLLVRKVPQIKNQYEGYVNQNKQSHNQHRLRSWRLLIKLNITYHIFKLNIDGNNFNECSTPYCGGSESSISYCKPINEFINELLQYDVVSFDVFDTLIFRPFARPTDLFYLIGEKLSYLDFTNIRIEMEQKARLKKFKKSNTYEVTLDDIYAQMEKYVGIDMQTTVKLEIETEMSLCYANPYMLEVFSLLEQHHKKVIIVSDMYLTSGVIEELLKKCGYSGYENIFVSCDYNQSKHVGGLYNLVKETVGKELSYVHIGDNMQSDVVQAKKHGFHAIYYPNVNEVGNQYRATDMSCIIGSAYSGTVNAHLHCGLNQYSAQYEYGYVYGGLFVLGYCRFIHEYAVQNNIHKVLFLARDGDILKQIYDRLYPENNSEYVYWSRLAATKLSANKNKYDYFKRFIDHKTDYDISIEQIFRDMELDGLISQCDLDNGEMLTKANAGQLQKYILDNWQIVLKTYEPQIQAGKQYYSKVLKDYKKVCAVDVGWAGSGANTLAYMVNDVWKINCEILGLLAGTNTPYNAEPNASEAMLQSGKMKSYLYSQNHNRNFWGTHNPNSGHNVYFEMLLSSVHPSFKGFELDDINSYKLLFGQNETENIQSILDIQTGISDFVESYSSHFGKYPYMMNISGSDAYAPFCFATRNGAKYLKYVLGGCSFNVLVGDDNHRRAISEQV